MSVQKKDKLFPTTMTTLSEVLEKLKNRGINNEFVFSDNKMEGMGTTYVPNDLILIRTFRFEGMSDPADNTALYLFEDKNKNIGFILDIYGGDSNYGVEFNDFLKAIPSEEEEQDFD